MYVLRLLRSSIFRVFAPQGRHIAPINVVKICQRERTIWRVFPNVLGLQVAKLLTGSRKSTCAKLVTVFDTGSVQRRRGLRVLWGNAIINFMSHLQRQQVSQSIISAPKCQASLALNALLRTFFTPSTVKIIIYFI